MRHVASACSVLSATWLVVLLVTPVNAQRTPSFRGLGDFPGGFHVSRAEGVSGDGRVVVGFGEPENATRAFRWSEDDGFQFVPPGPSGRAPIVAFDASFDGSVIVGIQDVLGPDGVNEAFRWTESTGAIGLGDFEGGLVESYAYGVSGDGSVIVGRGGDGNMGISFRWTQEDGLVPPGGAIPEFSTAAYGVSGDGLVAVGSMTTSLGQEAFRWTESTGYVGLGDLPGGDFRSKALAVSADGSVVVGWSEALAPDGDSTQQMFRWTEEEGMVGLGFLLGPNGLYGNGQGMGVSADGSVIVGDVNFIGAVIWDEVHGLRRLESVLRSEYGLAPALTGWDLEEATDISADGSVIVGWGTRPGLVSFETEAWVAVIPEPASIALWIIGVLSLGFLGIRNAVPT